jgi:hypothetical protein
VNGLVFAYKFTGNQTYLDAAWALWLRTQQTRWGAGRIGHFADTLLASATGFQFLAQNMGELQYVYALYENGGRPTLVSGSQPRPNPPTALSAQ